jgi:hypothetical protein
MALIEDEMQSFFPSIQYGVRRAGGSESAAQLIRAILQQSAVTHPNTTIALKTDFENAFNSVSRKLVWETLLRHRKAEPMLKAFYWQYADPSPLLVYDGPRLFAELESSEGVRQGDPFASFAFALAVQSLYERALAAAPACKAISIQDDFTIVGPADEVMAAYDYIFAHAHEFGLKLRADKCQVYIPPSTAQSISQQSGEAIAHVRELCMQRALQQRESMEALGVMYGTDADIERHCDAAVDESDFFFQAICHKEMGTQMAFSLLRYCGIPKLGFLARTTHPDRIDEAARRFDQMAMDTCMRVLRISGESLTALQPRDGEEEKEDGQRMSTVSQSQLLTRISLPITDGGLGMRPIHRIRHAAYFASLLQILPDFLRLYPELAVQPGGEGPLDGVHPHHATELYSELSRCRAELLATGANNRRTKHQLKQLSIKQSMQPLLQKAAGPSTATAAAAKASHSTPALSTDAQASSPLPALTKSIDDTWRSASACVTVKAGSAVFVRAIKLQHTLTAGLEFTLYVNCFNNCQRYQQTILTSISENTDCSAFLTVLPTEPAYRMRDEQFILAVRHRLGMLPYDDLRDEHCVDCRARNSTIPSFLADPDHLHACVHQTGSSVTLRHHRVVATLAQLARSVGYVVKVEPHFAPHVVTATVPLTGEAVTRVEQGSERGDLLLIRHNERFVIDVTVRRPTNQTELRGRADVNSKPLVVAAAAERQKHDKYDDQCRREGTKLIPFAMESYGAKGREARKLLLKLAEQADEVSAAQFLLHASAALSVALQSGNADIAARGAQDLRVHQHHQLSGLTARSASRRQREQRAARVQGEALHVNCFHSAYHSARKGGRCGPHTYEGAAA